MRVQKESSENKRKRRKSYPGFQSRGLVPSLFLSFLSFSPGDLDGSADVSFHNLIVLIKFRRRIALRWAYRPGGHNANRDVYRMNREWNSKQVRPVTFYVRRICSIIPSQLIVVALSRKLKYLSIKISFPVLNMYNYFNYLKNYQILNYITYIFIIL